MEHPRREASHDLHAIFDVEWAMKNDLIPSCLVYVGDSTTQYSIGNIANHHKDPY